MGSGKRPTLSNPTVAVRALKADQWSKADLGQRGLSRALVISESGLYKLVLRSDKAAADDFQEWVTRTVLPAIRKDGMYVAGEETMGQPGQDGRCYP